MFCKYCGQKLNEETSICPSCGANRLGSEASPPQPLKASATGQSNESQSHAPQPPLKKAKIKKKSGLLTALLIIISIASVAALSAYFLVPGLLRPNDLGIKSSAESYQSAVKKMNLTKDKAPTIGSATDYKVAYGKSQQVQTSLSSEEITSFLSENRPDYYALKNVQVRINPDNTVEASATLDTSYLFDVILGGQYNEEDAKRALPMLGLLPDHVNVYCMLDGSIQENKTKDLTLEKVSVMGIPVPNSILGSQDASAFVISTTNAYLKTTTAKSGANYDLLQVSNGELQLKGKIPSAISRIAVK